MNILTFFAWVGQIYEKYLGFIIIIMFCCLGYKSTNNIRIINFTKLFTIHIFIYL